MENPAAASSVRDGWFCLGSQLWDPSLLSGGEENDLLEIRKTDTVCVWETLTDTNFDNEGHFEGIMMDILACKRELNVFLLFSAIIIALGIH